MLLHCYIGKSVSSNQDTFDFREAIWVYRGELCNFPLSFGKFCVAYLMFLMQIILKDEVDIDPDDQNSILEHLDKVVWFVWTLWVYDVFFIYLWW